MALDSVASDLADTARVERAALDLLPGGSAIFDRDICIVSANRSERKPPCSCNDTNEEAVS
jgi:hypothetical protein